MKIETISLSSEGIVKNDFQSILQIKFDDKEMFYVHDGEPEDNNLGRNFNACVKIPEMLKIVYDAGKEGREVTFVNTKVDEI